MPQMSPLNWIMISLTMLLILQLTMSLIYFFFYFKLNNSTKMFLILKKFKKKW